MLMKMSIEHWWIDTERGKQRYREKNHPNGTWDRISSQ
jgi:ligand-binding sensor domain-containing protein